MSPEETTELSNDYIKAVELLNEVDVNNIPLKLKLEFIMANNKLCEALKENNETIRKIIVADRLHRP